jgi:hypothetical protein
MRRSPCNTPIGAGWFIVLADQDCGLHSDFSWSHLWSHSRRFRSVRSGLPSLGSGATRPNRTGLNHQPQNSKARELRDRSESHEVAAAKCCKLRQRPIRCGAPLTRACLDSGQRGRLSRVAQRVRTPTEECRPLAGSVLVSFVHVRRVPGRLTCTPRGGTRDRRTGVDHGLQTWKVGGMSGVLAALVASTRRGTNA